MMVNKSSSVTERISIMKGSRQIFGKEALFQLSGHGHPQDDSTLNYFPDSKSSILELSTEVSFYSKVLLD